MATKHYVRFWYAGCITADTSVAQVDDRDPKKVTMPEGAYAFDFFDREEIQSDGETLTGDRKNVSPTYYPGGKVKTLEQIKAANNPKDSILISNMECNGWTAMIYSRYDHWPQPYEEGKTVVIDLAA